jgi:endosialidase-like protein
MFQNFFATLLTGFALIAGTIAHDVAQLPTNVADLLSPTTATSLSYTRPHTAQSASAAASQSGNIAQPHQTTLSEEVKQAAFPPHAPTTGGATATSVAVSNTISPSPHVGAVLGASTQPIIQNVYQSISDGVSEAELDTRLDALTARFGAQLYGPSYPAPASTPNDGGLLGVIGMVGRVENLSGTKLSNITVAGVSGLTDADIPDGITASNYLPLLGGTLTGNLSLSGTLTAGTLSVAGLASGGAVAAPYFSATSTSASSTFTNFNVTNATATNATSTNLFSTLGHFTTGIIDALTSAAATITNLTATTITATSATTTNEYSSNLAAAAARFGGTATTTIDTGGNVAAAGTLNVTGKTTLASASTTNISATYASSTQGFFGSLSLGNLSGFLKATAGAITSALVDLTSNVTGILPVANGGTGWSSILTGYIPFGNGASALATSSSLFWDNTNNRLGIGTTSPVTTLAISGPTQSGSSATGTVAIAQTWNTTGVPGALKIDVTDTATGACTNNNRAGCPTLLSVTFLTSGGFFDVGKGTGGNPYAFISGSVGAANGPGYFAGLTGDTESRAVFDVNTSSQGELSFGPGNVVRDFKIARTGTAAATITGTLTGTLTGTFTGTVSASNNSTLNGVTNLTDGSGNTLGRLSYTATNGNSAWVGGPSKGVTIYTNDGNTRALDVTSAGNVGIGTTSPDMLLTVGGSSPSGSVAHFENSTGSCYINPTTTSLSCSSDVRLKTNVNSLASSTLDALLQLRPVTYNWKSESATTSSHTGFIAQEVQPILPDLISQGPDGFLTMNYAGLTPYLVKAVQELVQKFDDLATTVAGFAEKFTTKQLTFDRATGNNLTLSHELCINDDAGVPVCVTGTQLKSLLTGSVLGTHTQVEPTAAGAPRSGDDVRAPSGLAAPVVEPDTDTAATTTSPEAEAVPPGTTAGTEPVAPDNQPSASTAPEAANDNPQPQGAEQSSHDDNSPITPLPATGTDATSTPL